MSVLRVVMVVLIFLVSVACVQQPPPTAAPTPQAPITIFSDTTLTTDLSFEADGIIIGADDIVLDLGGHTITGQGKGPWIWPEPTLSAVGIRLKDREGITIKNGHVDNFGAGVQIENSNNIVVQNITVSLNHYGIYLWGSDNNTVTESDITSNVYGLTLMGASENRVIKNHMFNNHYNSLGGYGICLIASSSNIVTENAIDSNQAEGIWLAESWDNLIYHNNVMGNQPDAVDVSGVNLWYNPALKEGNYWGDYTGKDSDSDGIGDTPYQFFNRAQDPFPFINMDDW